MSDKAEEEVRVWLTDKAFELRERRHRLIREFVRLEEDEKANDMALARLDSRLSQLRQEAMGELTDCRAKLAAKE